MADVVIADILQKNVKGAGYTFDMSGAFFV